MSDNELELQRETCERIRKEGVTWFGPITDWNIEAIADRLRLMLIGKRHTKAKLMTMFSPQDSMDLTTHLYVEEIKDPNAKPGASKTYQVFQKTTVSQICIQKNEQIGRAHV